MSAPITFVSFLEESLGFRLEPAQRVWARVAVDGVDPIDLNTEEQPIAAQLFGAVDRISPLARAVIVLVKGARSGGTLFCSLATMFLALTTALANRLAPGEQAFCLIVAPDLRLARQAIRYVQGWFERSKALKERVISSTADSITFKREVPVTIECLPATRGGSALRGRSLICAMLTECAFFRDETYVVNDSEVFKAIAPRIIRGGRILIESTPFSESGLLYELFQQNHGAPSTALAAHAPTLLMRGDNPHIRSIVERERERDPDNAMREFDAQFISGGASAFFDGHAISESVDQNLRLPVAHDASARVFVGVDWGFVADSTAAVVAQVIGKMVFISDILELRPQKGAPLVPSEAAASVAECVKRYRGHAIISDRYYVDAMAEHLNEHGVSVTGAPEGQNGKSLAYTVARSLVHEGRVRLPAHGRLLAQLRQVVGKPTSGGHIQISSPRWRTGGHGDICSALVLALWQANEANLWTYTPPRQVLEDRRAFENKYCDFVMAPGATATAREDGRVYLTQPRPRAGIFSGGSAGGGY